MKIETTERGSIIIKEVFSGVTFETEEGNRLGVCMRDDTFEISVLPADGTVYRWFRVNLERIKSISINPL